MAWGTVRGSAVAAADAAPRVRAVVSHICTLLLPVIFLRSCVESLVCSPVESEIVCVSLADVPIAQLAEHLAYVGSVEGSTPSRSISFSFFSFFSKEMTHR